MKQKSIDLIDILYKQIYPTEFQELAEDEEDIYVKSITTEYSKEQSEDGTPKSARIIIELI